MILPGVFSSTRTYNITVCFRSGNGPFLLRAVNPQFPNIGQTIINDNGNFPNFTTVTKKGVAINDPGYTALQLTISPQLSPPGIKFDIKNLQITTDVPAKVSDSDMRWAGRRTSYYQGTRISSLDVNINSANVVDGGPVVVINTVNSDTPLTPMIPLISNEARRLVNVAPQPIVPSSDRLVDPGRALVNRTEEARRLVNIAQQPIMPSSDRIGRALVNIAGQPIVTTEARRLVNRSES